MLRRRTRTLTLLRGQQRHLLARLRQGRNESRRVRECEATQLCYGRRVPLDQLLNWPHSFLPFAADAVNLKDYSSPKSSRRSSGVNPPSSSWLASAYRMTNFRPKAASSASTGRSPIHCT